MLVEQDRLIDHQLELERLYDKNQLLSRMHAEFAECEEFDFAAHMEAHEIPLKFGFDVLVQMALHKRTTLPILVSILMHHFKNAQATADMLLKCAEADLMDWDPELKKFIVRYTMNAEVQAELDMFQFPLPMVVQPQMLVTNSDSGYLTGRGSVILKKNHHDEDVCLDHINRVNAIKFSLDHDTAMMIRNSWRNLDKPKPGESREDFQKRKCAFEKYDRNAKEAHELILMEGNEFYLTHKYDKRGRIYCQGYHINYQGAPWNKAVVQLAEKEIVE